METGPNNLEKTIAEIKAGNKERRRLALEAATQPALTQAAIDRMAIESTINSAS